MLRKNGLVLLLFWGIPLFVQRAKAQDAVARYLYDLDTDPFEDNNLFNDSAYADILEHMQAAAEELAVAVTGNTGWVSTNDDDPRAAIDQLYLHEATAPNIVLFVIDDMGSNQMGYQSTIVPWVTPHMNLMSEAGIRLSNYLTHEYCPPSRRALLTGRYAARLTPNGHISRGALNLAEVTIAEELQSAGYRTYHIGKWFASATNSPSSYNPVKRGFDYFYGNLLGGDFYYTRMKDGIVEVYENLDRITASNELDPALHGMILYETKAELILADHKENYAGKPFFLFFSSLLLHSPVHQVDDKYAAACYASGVAESSKMLCGMTAMLDDVLRNLTCKIDELGFADNTLYVVMSDNGAALESEATNYPLRGGKADKFLGGTLVPAFMYSPLIPTSARGTTYNGTVHVTDWLPTLMGLATANTWRGSYTNATIDGVDVWDAIISNNPSPRTATLHYSFESSTALDREVSYQEHNYRYIQDTREYGIASKTKYVFDQDFWAGVERETCLSVPPLPGVDDFYGMDVPSFEPTTVPWSEPTVVPWTAPSVELSVEPSVVPSTVPSAEPSLDPTTLSSFQPLSTEPTTGPSPTAVPTFVINASPSFRPTTSQPTVEPSIVPTTIEPTPGPTIITTSRPTTSQPTSAGAPSVPRYSLGWQSLALVAACIAWAQLVDAHVSD